MNSTPHLSVMLPEVLEQLAPKDGEIYVDGTFGAGGYSKAILESADCKVIAIDRDPTVKPYVELLQQQYQSRLQFIEGCFGDLESLLEQHNIGQVNGIVLDIGVSSMQLDQAERGFSFSKEGALDMRMAQSGIDASTLVNETSEEELANIIYKYGGERMSRRIARAIVIARTESPITTTTKLAEIIKKAVRVYNDKIDPATRTFQALRIWVNDELGELERSLQASERLLLPEGRLVVVTFHSLEDRIVKQHMAKKSGKKEGVSRHLPDISKNDDIIYKQVTKAIKPSKEEVVKNPRSRSAKLRAAIRNEIQPPYTGGGSC